MSVNMETLQVPRTFEVTRELISAMEQNVHVFADSEFIETFSWNHRSASQAGIHRAKDGMVTAPESPCDRKPPASSCLPPVQYQLFGPVGSCCRPEPWFTVME